MSSGPFVLIVDDEKTHRQLYADTLSSAGIGVKTASSAEEAEEMILSGKPPIMVISDVRMPGRDGVSFLKRIKETFPDMPCMLITAFPDIKDAVKALKTGAVDYLEKPVDLDELVAAVTDTLGLRKKNSNPDIPSELLNGIIVESPVTKSIFRDALRVAQSEANILITGESGTGKEVLAHFIHAAGKDAGSPFLPFNCAAAPRDIIASELFGHVKGAYTGAVSDRKGLFRMARGGTVFLDEIGDMPLELQPALLRVIETSKVSPVGSDYEEEACFRLIAATNKNLHEEVKAGRFREDLFYRLNVIAFNMPPLRERQDEILPLAKLFLNRALKNKTGRLSASALSCIRNYSWPGNVRELANSMERAALLSNTEIILPEHLPSSIAESPVVSGTGKSAGNVKTMEQAEAEAIKSALEKTKGNRTKAAQLLGISRRALIYKLKRYNID